ncbi:hypothetical protein EMPS_00117 [Entomortierella parvispora]|uniref:Uncharacterized protein n=1 Tax=Entomortierella parvispora TaxID=205924 RepID=A0A9P3GZ87_9FUNG|nr:hypothetical protein EMPS_00117 [Entomortierella parvispora]
MSMMSMIPSFIVIKSKAKWQQPGYLQQPTVEPECHKGDMAALTDQLDQTQIYNDDVEDVNDEYGFQEQGFFGPGGLDAGANETLLGLRFRLESQGDGNDSASQRVSEPKRVQAVHVCFSKTAKKMDMKDLKLPTSTRSTHTRRFYSQFTTDFKKTKAGSL